MILCDHLKLQGSLRICQELFDKYNIHSASSALHYKIDQNSLIEQSLTIIVFNRAITHTKKYSSHFYVTEQ